MLRLRGAEPLAVLLDSCAGELERFDAAYLDEPLPLARASDESGLSSSWLGRQVNDGKIPNAGRPGAPMIRRSDLPRLKPPPRRRPDGQPDLAGPVLERQGLMVPEDM